MIARSALAFGALSLTNLLGCSGDGGGLTDGNSGAEGGAQSDEGNVDDALDPLTPPSDPELMAEWKAAFVKNGWESQWICEAEGTTKTLPASSAHPQPTRVCSNPLLAEQTLEVGQQLPRGVAAVKFIPDGGMYVEVKVEADSAGGDGWIWSAPGGGGTKGWRTCTGCHGAAAPSAEILGDYVYVHIRAM